MRAVVCAAVVCAACACGYSEAAMQSQRDQIEGLHAALVEVSTTADTYEATIAKLTAENERLTTQCKEPPQ